MFHDVIERDHYDAVIVGARCAGAATAMLLARGGARVLLVDRAPGVVLVDRTLGATDTLSTHALMRPAVSQLARWGLLANVIAVGTPPIRRTTFHYGTEDVAVEIEPRNGIDALYAPRRFILDGILAEAAKAAGVEVCHRVAFRNVERDRWGRVCAVALSDATGRTKTVSTDLLIGADGLRSTVAEAVAARVEHEGLHRTGLVYSHVKRRTNTGYHWYYRPGLSVGAIPTNNGQQCVFACVTPARFKADMASGGGAAFEAIIASVDGALAEDVTRSRPHSRLFRFAGCRGYLRQSHGAGWVLVGDAGYFKDPITAHGISDAMLDAERLANAVLRAEESALSDYQSERDTFARPLLDVTDQIAGLDWDLADIKRHHKTLAACMKAELEHAPDAPRHAA